MEIKISIKTGAGDILEIVREIEDLGAESNLGTVEQLVKQLGDSVLPELEGKLVEQMSETFVGKKKEDQERDQTGGVP
jgi:hypothetical protein